MSPDIYAEALVLPPRARTRLFANARLVLPESVIQGWVAIAGDRILALGEGMAPEGGIDLQGDYLLPGLIELHTDHLESHVQPRPKVRWNLLGAALAYDAQIAASGITTVFDSLRVGSDADGGGLGSEVLSLAETLDQAQRQDLFRAEHRTHLRCEVPAPDVVQVAAQLLERYRIGLISLMDHTPGQRQFRDLEWFYAYAARHGAGRSEVEAAAARKIALAGEASASNRADLVALARAHAVPMASHDDTTLEDVAQSAGENVALAEFPTTLEAAEACKAHGITVMMGAPNLIRGGSHSGNVSAAVLAERGLLQVLSSDYVPASLLLAAFRLPVLVPGITLPQAVAMVSRNPAQATGLLDRGEIAPGRRADLVRVQMADEQPVVRQVWRSGERVI
jgi:alpha-D-ribose 1-methylphosphonate 5-triphosphate diphosphatase